MYKYRYFTKEPSGTYAHTSEVLTRDDAYAMAHEISEQGHHVLILQRMRGGWHVIFDSESGY